MRIAAGVLLLGLIVVALLQPPTTVYPHAGYAHSIDNIANELEETRDIEHAVQLLRDQAESIRQADR
jgi:hypothetical protein